MAGARRIEAARGSSANRSRLCGGRSGPTDSSRRLGALAMTGAYTLAIDGSTYQGSVALVRESKVVAERTLREDDGAVPRAGRGEKLMPAIADCLREAGV